MNKIKLEPHTEAVVLQFLETASKLELRLDRALSGSRGISFREYRLISVIATSPLKGCSRVDLANQVGLTASAVTRALKPLEKLGYVKTQRHERDARQSLATITPGGLELLEDAHGIVKDVLHQLPINTLSGKKVAEFCNRLNELVVK